MSRDNKSLDNLLTENPVRRLLRFNFLTLWQKMLFLMSLHILMHLRSGVLNSAHNLGLETFIRTFGPGCYNKPLLPPQLIYLTTYSLYPGRH